MRIGEYRYVARRKDGSVIKRGRAKNTITHDGMKEFIRMCAAFSPSYTFTLLYMGLIDDDTYTAVAPADTSASHSGWTEWETYNVGGVNTVRPEMAWATATTNPAEKSSDPILFEMEADVVLRGFFVSTSNVLGGSGGLLWSTAILLTAPLTLLNGETVEVTYTCKGKVT